MNDYLETEIRKHIFKSAEFTKPSCKWLTKDFKKEIKRAIKLKKAVEKNYYIPEYLNEALSKFIQERQLLVEALKTEASWNVGEK